MWNEYEALKWEVYARHAEWHIGGQACIGGQALFLFSVLSEIRLSTHLSAA